jgi:hypothetical protein
MIKWPSCRETIAGFYSTQSEQLEFIVPVGGRVEISAC